METFSYGKADLHEAPLSWKVDDMKQKLSPFDEILQRTWRTAEDNKMFNYSLSDNRYKSITGEWKGLPYKCLAVLNINRVLKRRAPHVFQTMNEPFQNDRFNFTKLKKEEFLFEIVPRLATTKQSPDDHKSYCVINASPIDNFHMLIVPQMMARHPQRLTADAVLLALDILQLSSQPSFRVGFNSLHAWASINHLHLHAMYCESELFVDDFPNGDRISDNCYLIDERTLIPGFVFTIPFDDRQRVKTSLEVQDVVNCLHQNQVPYTVIFTRGGSVYGTRCFIWPRKSTQNMEPSDVFNLACIEVGGHYSIRTNEEFEKLTFEKAVETTLESKLAEGKFEEIVAQVKVLSLKW